MAGDVTLDAKLSDLSALSELRRIGEDFTFSGSAESLAQLVALQRVDGNVAIFTSPEAEGVLLGNLRWVGGNLRVESLLHPEAFSALRYIGGDLEVAEQTQQHALGPFASLAAVGGSLTLHSVFSQGLPALTSVGLDLTVLGATDVQLSSLAQLRAVGGNLSIRESVGTGPLLLSALVRVGQRLQLFANPRLERVDLPLLASASALELRLNPALSRCQLDELTARVAATLDDEPLICCNQGCEHCDGSSCQQPGSPSAGQSTMFSGPIYVGRQVPPAALTSVETAGHLELRYWEDDPLPALALIQADQVVVRWNEQLTDLSALSALRRVKFLDITGNPGLTSLRGLEGLARIGEVRINHNDLLRDISALDVAHGSELTELSGDVTLVGNGQLSECRARALLQSLEPLSPGIRREAQNLPCPGSCVAGECTASGP